MQLLKKIYPALSAQLSIPGQAARARDIAQIRRTAGDEQRPQRFRVILPREIGSLLPRDDSDAGSRNHPDITRKPGFPGVNNLNEEKERPLARMKKSVILTGTLALTWRLITAFSPSASLAKMASAAITTASVAWLVSHRSTDREPEI